MAKQNRVCVMRPRKTQHGDYVIPVFVDGYESIARTYHTDDKIDAEGTYLAMLEAAEKECANETNLRY